MHKVEQEKPPKHFEQAWAAAGRHIQNRIGPKNWLRSNLHQPFSEHLSFRLGNQVFMVYVDPYVNGEPIYPCTENRRRLFLQIIEDANAFGCILRMDMAGEEFRPFYPDWGMIDISTEKSIDPAGKISDALIEMTDWELLDFGIQVVRHHLTEDGKELTSWQSSLQIDPSIWFNDADGFHWVVVRVARYPEESIPVPQNIDAIRKACAEMGDDGFFAQVILASADDEFTGQNVKPLHRGHGLFPKFQGLQPL